VAAEPIVGSDRSRTSPGCSAAQTRAVVGKAGPEARPEVDLVVECPREHVVPVPGAVHPHALGADADEDGRALAKAAVVRGAEDEAPRGAEGGEAALHTGHGRLDEVPHPEEVGHEARARPLVERLRALQLLDAAVAHDRDPVGHDERLLLVVGHEDEGRPQPLLEVLHLDLHLLAEAKRDMLVRLLYASRADREVDDAFVASILERSQKYNLEHGITGILCTYSQGNVFIQVLEGARAAVNTLYGAIVRDPRHRDVTLLDYAEITERRFASWRMGSVNLNGST
jgi:hypothetical protein